MANKVLGEAGVDQLVREMQQRYDKLDSFMVLDPSNKSRFKQSLLSYVLSPAYCPIIFIKDVLVTMDSLVGVGSNVKFIKSPGTVSPIMYSSSNVTLGFLPSDMDTICDNFANMGPGEIIATLKYQTIKTVTYKSIVLFNVTKNPKYSPAKDLDAPIDMMIESIGSANDDFETLLNQKIENYGADSGTIVENLNSELIKAGNIIQIEDSLFSIVSVVDFSILRLVPLEITAAEVTNKFNS